QKQPRPAAEVQQSPPGAIVEYRGDRVHHHPVAALAVAGVLPGQEPAVAGGVQVTQAFGPDVRIAVEEPAAGAADHGIFPGTVAGAGPVQRLLAALPAQHTRDDFFDLAHGDPGLILRQREHGGAPEPPGALPHADLSFAGAEIDLLRPRYVVIPLAVHHFFDQIFHRIMLSLRKYF